MAKTDFESNELFSDTRQRLKLSRSELAEAANCEPVMRTCDHTLMTENFIGRIEQGRIGGGICPERLTALCAVLNVADPADIGLVAERRRPTRSGPARRRKPRIVAPRQDYGDAPSAADLSRPSRAAGDDEAPTVLAAAEEIRLRVESALGDSDVAPESLDDWEGVVARHARATRYRPPAVLCADLLVDADDAQQLLYRRHTAHSLQRATRITAQMAGLLSLTLLKLNEFAAAQQWGRTARIAAAGCGDPATKAWVWAQEAHRYFYADDWGAAIDAAERAQEQVKAGGVGPVLASALEARARAAIGDAAGTRTALGRAEEQLAALSPVETAASALGYDEAQLRFHAGNAFTHLGDSESARTAQKRALELYPAANYLDRTLIYLDQAACLIQEGDLKGGSRHVVNVLSALPPQQLDRLVIARAEAIVGPALPADADSSAVREVHEFLEMIKSTGAELSQ
ncbi:hypothetical protein [Actinoplanes sp. NBRC 103695]|uniref:hypothetical protein n=1 Tax=Actinoplanes sp. NBRC 103695 TaxID=3032202 RepID=UPI0024A357FC|nr:hypothetical protein [Actinoplanes sp. NBRC 103695]GLZ00760.1 hypothetical protein Acsp02_80120 [Actinoplanes sp. NBRC 103695]